MRVDPVRPVVDRTGSGHVDPDRTGSRHVDPDRTSSGDWVAAEPDPVALVLLTRRPPGNGPASVPVSHRLADAPLNPSPGARPEPG